MRTIRTPSAGRAIAAPAAAAAAACILLSACGGGGSTTSSAPAAQPSTGPAAAAAVKAMWVRFVNGTVPIPDRLKLLQDGPAFASFVHSQENTTIGAMVLTATATVSSVQVGPPGQAAVVFTILLAGRPLAKNLHGTAVYSGGRWLVTANTFCTLLREAYGTKGPKMPAVCPPA
jgi:hypothetical protein